MESYLRRWLSAHNGHKTLEEVKRKAQKTTLAAGKNKHSGGHGEQKHKEDRPTAAKTRTKKERKTQRKTEKRRQRKKRAKREKKRRQPKSNGEALRRPVRENKKTQRIVHRGEGERKSREKGAWHKSSTTVKNA